MDGQRLATRFLQRITESEHYIVLRKPAGLSVHSPQKGLAGGVMQAVSAIASYGADKNWQVCYRLDKYTSGVLVIAKSSLAAERFQECSKADGVTRRFVAVVRGFPKSHQAAAAPGGKSKRVATIPVDGAQVSVLQKLERFSVVSVTQRGGAKVRVRDLLKSLKSPVVADARFDPRAMSRQSGRFFLHLESVAFKNPFTEKDERFETPPPASFDEVARGNPFVDEHLEAALSGRMSCLLDGDSDAYRLFNGRGDGISGLFAEKLGDVVVLQAQQGKFDGGERVLREAAKWYARTMQLTTVYAKTLPRDRSSQKKPSEETAPKRDRTVAECKPVWGEAGDSEITVCETGIRFVVKPKERYQVGLFLDQRENRRRLMELAQGKRVLNLFAYTCAFSVAAARAGAAGTANVDVSKKALEWGKVNFEANEIPLDDHRFYCCDAFAFFKRATRQELKYDIIILDPPTFARTKKPPTVFQVQKDMVRLIQGALTLLDRRGAMLVSTNHRELSEAWIREQLEQACGQRTFKPMKPLTPQPDFAGSRDAAKSLWVRF